MSSSVTRLSWKGSFDVKRGKRAQLREICKEQVGFYNRLWSRGKRSNDLCSLLLVKGNLFYFFFLYLDNQFSSVEKNLVFPPDIRTSWGGEIGLLFICMFCK